MEQATIKEIDGVAYKMRILGNEHGTKEIVFWRSMSRMYDDRPANWRRVSYAHNDVRNRLLKAFKDEIRAAPTPPATEPNHVRLARLIAKAKPAADS